MQETLWKSKTFWKTRICALASELELKQVLLIGLASHWTAFDQRDQFPQTILDRTPGNARELLCTIVSAPQAIEVQVAGCTMEKADAEK